MVISPARDLVKLDHLATAICRVRIVVCMDLEIGRVQRVTPTHTSSRCSLSAQEREGGDPVRERDTVHVHSPRLKTDMLVSVGVGCW